MHYTLWLAQEQGRRTRAERAETLAQVEPGPPRTGQPFTEVEGEAILALRQQGWTHSMIAKRLGRSRGSIAMWFVKRSQAWDSDDD